MMAAVVAAPASTAIPRFLQGADSRPREAVQAVLTASLVNDYLRLQALVRAYTERYGTLVEARECNKVQLGTLKTQKGLNVACNSSFFELASGSNSLKRFVLHDHPADRLSPKRQMALGVSAADGELATLPPSKFWRPAMGPPPGLGIPAAMFEGIDGSEVLLRFAIGDDAASVLGFFGDGKKLGLGIPAAMFEGIDGSEVLLRFAIGDDAASVLGFFGDGDGEARSITSWCESRKLRNAWATCSRLTFTRTCSSDRIRG
eukprot:s1433_g7.t1